MGSLWRTPGGGLALASSGFVENDLGWVPIIYVRAEHLDEGERPTPSGRFGALRELSRLIARQIHGDGEPWHLDPTPVTPEVHGGDFLEDRFFYDPLNRWAMHLGCPPPELTQLVKDSWGEVPVGEAALRESRPLWSAGKNRLECVFLEEIPSGKRLERVFGLSPNAIVAWCRYLGLIDC